MSTKPTSPTSPRLTYRQSEIVQLLGISLPTWHRMRRTGIAPPPDITLGNLHLWSRDTLETWIASRPQSAACNAS
jgi:predicted DNA-binding transcriptional regulator AlpA